MISKLLQQYEIRRYSKRDKEKWPNYLQTKAIILSSPRRRETFEMAYPHFECKSCTKNGYGDKYIDSFTGEEYKLITYPRDCRGHRFYKAIIDSTIDETSYKQDIAPYLSLFCCYIEFFN